MEIEIWKDIENFKGLYQISNLGNVKSLERTTSQKHKLKEKLRALTKDKDGYLQLTLYNNSYSEHWRVHQLIGIYFIPNPENKPQLNHKNGIRWDNNSTNLEWSTVKENIRHSFDVLNRQIHNKGKFGKDHNASIEIVQIKEYSIINWDSMIDVKRTLGLTPSGISACCRGIQKTAYGSIWMYKSEFEEISSYFNY